jgi:hypothetical protein
MTERFEEEFKMCKVGSFCVGLAHATTGPTPYIFMGCITEVNTAERTMMVKPYNSTHASWDPACIDSKWHRHGNGTSQPHYAIMAYFPKENRSHELPAAVKNKVRSRTIEWAK